VIQTSATEGEGNLLIRSKIVRRIGPWGTRARVVVGVAMVVGAFVAGVRAVDAAVGLVVAPIVISAVVALRGRHRAPLRLTGIAGHCLNCGMIAVAFVVLPVAALLFYGVAMLVAATRGYGGCELFAVSNWLWRRDDQIACPLFEPIDSVEARGV
jgi:hypothetical protein